MLFRERGVHELYADDPERADALLLGRRWDKSRRGFLGGAGLASLTALVGGPIAFSHLVPGGVIPRVWAQGAAKEPKLLKMDGKAELIVLGDRPLVAETPAHLLDDAVTPTEKFFIRHNGTPPEPVADADKWEIAIDGEVQKPLKIALGDLKKRFRKVAYVLQLECGGNGRSFFEPTTRGNQWQHGGVGCARWGGVALADLLRAAGLKPSAKYTAHYGADIHLSGDPNQPTISRGVRLPKALDPHTILAFEMNGKPLPHVHGGPARLLVPGWSGSASQKWLKRIWVRDKEHDGPGMTGFSYRMPIVPGVPGGKFDEKNMRILESMPVRSVITNVRDGAKLPAKTREIALSGHAWAGDLAVAAVHVSADYGATWRQAAVKPPVNRYAWQDWQAKIGVPSAGYYELWVRATDANGLAQPHQAGNWNPQGYGGNPFHRVRVLIEA
jgi:DMSO/TMAO reductase YedYZ molybdopterin-dependent catalytic subunit